MTSCQNKLEIVGIYIYTASLDIDIGPFKLNYSLSSQQVSATLLVSITMNMIAIVGASLYHWEYHPRDSNDACNRCCLIAG